MKKRLDFRIEELEFQILEEYCELVGRTKTDVLRELIRSLKKKKPIARTTGLYPDFSRARKKHLD
ncbi:MAG: CopG family transcriptional regulator [Nostoc sp. JL33]|uniref:CopG family transcriptional regulator n=2 Tax=unclassified Nostoc TaxID=2593658 RepID=UPI0025DCE56E|nr:CopG family transcriptional regulator [Nostoc sp. JL33]MBN3873472.1 CopG family transcriptional regulator [Nostoc sp. JL33]